MSQFDPRWPVARPRPSSTDITTVITSWLARHAVRSPETLETYRETWNRIQAALPPHTRFETLDLPGAVQCVRTWEASYAPATVALMVSVARQATQALMAAGLRSDNPWTEISPPKPKDTRAERILTPGEVRQLLEAATGRDRALLEALYYLGARVSEAICLRWRDVHRYPGEKATVTLYGKGKKTREVPCPSWLLARLEAVCGPTDADHFLFPGNKPDTHLTRQEAWRVVKRAARRAGLRKSPSPHWFRHSHATHALAAGQPLPEVQADLGHARLDTTATYLHIGPAAARSSVLVPPTDLHD
jgi:site-specific recombinase XerD